jgi:hypothetical protein
MNTAHTSCSLCCRSKTLDDRNWTLLIKNIDSTGFME